MKQVCKIVCGILLLTQVHLYAQQALDSPKYVITDITYNIKGLVTIAAFESKLDLQKGLEFVSLDDLFIYVTNKKDEITNIRALTDLSTIVFEYKWNPSEKRYDVELMVYVTSGWNLLALPYFRFSDSSGLLGSVRGRNYNFLGSLEPFYVNLDYDTNPFWREGQGDLSQGVELSLGFQYPFKYEKNRFKLIIEESARYEIENTMFENDVKLTLEYSYPLSLSINMLSSISQSFIDVVDTRYNFLYGKNAVRYGFAFTLNKRPIEKIHNIIYSIYTQYALTYPIVGDDKIDDRLNQEVSFVHSLNFGTRKWVHFFRKGAVFTISNPYTYDWNEQGWEATIRTEIKWHLTASNIFGVNFRFVGFQNFFFYPENVDVLKKGTNVGTHLRGIKDDEFEYSVGGALLNADIMIKLFQIRPIAEFHLGPFVDVGWRYRHENSPIREQEMYGLEDFKYSVGIQGLAHALFSNSIVVIGSYGIDVGKLIESNGEYNILSGAVREIFIGLGMFY